LSHLLEFLCFPIQFLPSLSFQFWETADSPSFFYGGTASCFLRDEIYFSPPPSQTGTALLSLLFRLKTFLRFPSFFLFEKRPPKSRKSFPLPLQNDLLPFFPSSPLFFSVLLLEIFSSIICHYLSPFTSVFLSSFAEPERIPFANKQTLSPAIDFTGPFPDSLFSSLYSVLALLRNGLHLFILATETLSLYA